MFLTSSSFLSPSSSLSRSSPVAPYLLFGAEYAVCCVFSAFFLLRRIGATLPFRFTVAALFASATFVFWLGFPIGKEPWPSIIWVIPSTYLPIIVSGLMVSALGSRVVVGMAAGLLPFAPLWFFGNTVTASLAYITISALVMTLWLLAWKFRNRLGEVAHWLEAPAVGDPRKPGNRSHGRQVA
jgi:hypothetical protein